MILSKLTEYLKANPGPHKTAQMAKAVGANKNTCRRMMGELRQLGMAEIVGHDGMECLWQWIEPKPKVVERIEPKPKAVERIVLKPVQVIREVVKFVQAPYPVKLPAQERVIEKVIEKPVYKTVFLHRGGEGETTPESLRAQEVFFKPCIELVRQRKIEQKRSKLRP